MPHFEINQRCFPTQKCAASTETVCGMLRFGVRLFRFTVRLAPFYAFPAGALFPRRYRRSLRAAGHDPPLAHCVQALLKDLDSRHRLEAGLRQLGYFHGNEEVFLLSLLYLALSFSISYSVT
jgi:hypothetical protein